MMSDLVGFINELVDDQIQMRSCIPLTPELKDFYRQLMAHKTDGEASDDDEDEPYERFVKPKRRITRTVVFFSLEAPEIMFSL